MSDNGFAVVRVGNGKLTHVANDFGIENGYARCGAESRVNRGLGGRRGLTVIDREVSHDTVTCSKCRRILAELAGITDGRALTTEAQVVAAERSSITATAGNISYRVAAWGVRNSDGADVGRVERVTVGDDGRALSTGDYITGELVLADAREAAAELNGNINREAR